MSHIIEDNEYNVFKINMTSGIEVVLSLYLSGILGYWTYDIWVSTLILDPASSFGRFMNLFSFIGFPIISWVIVNLAKARYKDKGIGIRVFIFMFLIILFVLTLYSKS